MTPRPTKNIVYYESLERSRTGKASRILHDKLWSEHPAIMLALGARKQRKRPVDRSKGMIG